MSRLFPAILPASTCGEWGRYPLGPRAARQAVTLPAAASDAFACTFPVMGAAGPPSGAFPDWSSLLSVHSQSRAVVFPTSPTCLVEGVRSGTRRRRGAGTSVQAAGGPGRERSAQRPHARAGRCIGDVPPLNAARPADRPPIGIGQTNQKLISSRINLFWVPKIECALRKGSRCTCNRVSAKSSNKCAQINQI